MEARGTAEGEGMLLLRRGRRRCRGGCRGDLLSALPVLLCSGAWTRSGTRGRGGGLGRTRSRGRGRTGTLGVVHVLSSRPGVRLPVGVVILFSRKNKVNNQWIFINLLHWVTSSFNIMNMGVSSALVL